MFVFIVIIINCVNSVLREDLISVFIVGHFVMTLNNNEHDYRKRNHFLLLLCAHTTIQIIIIIIFSCYFYDPPPPQVPGQIFIRLLFSF